MSHSFPIYYSLYQAFSVFNILAALMGCALCCQSANAQLDVSIDTSTRSTEGLDLNFTVGDLSVLPGGEPPSGYNGLVLQYSTNLQDWETLPPSVVGQEPATSTTPPAGGQWAVTHTAPDPTGFFRFIGVVTTESDSDGDGVPNTYENGAFGTAETNYDTDGDGFSDGTELLYGADANDSQEVPSLITEPRAVFLEYSSDSSEGISGSHDISIHFDQPFYGTLNYSVGTESTVTAGQDYLSLPLSVEVMGSSAVISISWIDDHQVSPSRLMFIEIEDGLGYSPGGQTRHMVLLSENDAWWEGVVVDTYAQRNFRLKITRDASSTNACFAAGAGNDGLTSLASESSGSESDVSVGMIPSGIHPATVVADSETHFEIDSPDMAAATGGLFGSSAGMVRNLKLQSIPVPQPSNGQLIEPLRIVGSYTECLTLPGQPACVEQNGAFVIVKQLPAAPETSL